MLEIPIQIPDLWQQEAVRALRAGRDVILDAPTGAGKTRVFELYVEAGQALRERRAVYTVPTRALANDKWREWTAMGWNVGIATGDIAKNLHAPVIVATLETQRERILAGDAPGLLVIDEYQLIADDRRGLNYELALALPPETTQLLLLSGSVRNPGDLAAWLQRLGRTPELIRVTERPVPLEDFAVRDLPRVSEAVQGFWPRVALGVLAAGLSPLLIFAPRRKEAEKLARQIAAAVPVDEPLPIGPDEAARLGSEMTRMLQKRVAFHHSGLPYAVRADWVERLGKIGALRVIVATTGLAAGINFSVRSVIVASVKYSDGPFHRELRPDELLQMFGRAGRRGLDERGHVLYAENTPRLFDASPRQIRRVNQLDWPTLLRVMETAAADGKNPILRAEEVVERLFGHQRQPIGLEMSQGASPDERLGPTRREVLHPDGRWRPLDEAFPQERPLGDALVFHREKWIPAVRSPRLVETLGPGRICRLPLPDGFSYGREVIMAKTDGEGRWSLLPWVRKRLGITDVVDDVTLHDVVLPLLATDWQPARIFDTTRHGVLLAVRLDLCDWPLPVLQVENSFLFDPPTRRVAVRNETSYRREDGGVWNPPPGSAAFAWRRLGLVDESGIPTSRGRIMSRFQAGEGLMIAAALEDRRYPVEDIVCHMANLRGGYRFQDFADGTSQRLAFAARSVFGHIDLDGYLEAGLCPGFGEGTWEALEKFRQGGMRAIVTETQELSRGDLERADLEWRSLLRHVVHASDPDSPRWPEFQAAAKRVLAEFA